MIHIRKETLRFMKCQSCLTDKNLNDIKIQYPDSAHYQSITLCGNCIQHLVNLYQKDKHSYITGAKENDVFWHDLRKNPDDLPKVDRLVRVRLSSGMEHICETCYYEPSEDEIGYGKLIISFYELDGEWIDDTEIIAWCEIPKFEVTE